MENEILIVLPYSQSGVQGNEMRLTLNGWKKFCTFKYHFIVIGEFDESLKTEFPWIEFINSPKIPKVKGQYNQHLDVRHCMETVMNMYGEKYNGFIWMSDDNYAVKPFTIDDITTIHYHSESFFGNKNTSANFWTHDKWKTRQLLDKAKLPHINYTTHYPCYFEFSKLEEIWKKFNMFKESYVLEDIYFNYFPHPKPIKDDTIRLGVWNQKIYKNEFQKAMDNPNIKFVCNSVSGWSEELENSLQKIVNNTHDGMSV